MTSTTRGRRRWRRSRANSIELGVTLVLCDVEPRVRKELDAYGLTAKIGEDHLFDSVSEVLAAYRQLPPPASASAPSA